MFILTARAPESAPAIKEFLDAMGINIPLENITGLGNSTGKAKADWLVDKASEGYNDFYFADDAPQNVKAVRDALEVLDVKSKTQQAYASKDLSREFTFEDYSITDPKERAKIFGQYDHVRVYGRDYFDKLRKNGFDVTAVDYTKKLSKEEIEQYRLAQGELIPVCRKF